MLIIYAQTKGRRADVYMVKNFDYANLKIDVADRSIDDATMQVFYIFQNSALIYLLNCSYTF